MQWDATNSKHMNAYDINVKKGCRVEKCKKIDQNIYRCIKSLELYKIIENYITFYSA